VDPWKVVLMAGDAEVNDHHLLAELCAHDDCNLQVCALLQEAMPQDVLDNTRMVLNCIAKAEETPISWRINKARSCRPSAGVVAKPCTKQNLQPRIRSHRSHLHQSVANKKRTNRMENARRMGRTVAREPEHGYWRREWGGPMVQLKFVQLPRKMPCAKPRAQFRNLSCGLRFWHHYQNPCADPIPHMPLSIPDSVKQDIKVGRVALRGAVGQRSLLLAALRRLVGPSLLELTDLLLRGGENVNVRDGNGMQPLHVACSLGRGKLALLLLKHGAHIHTISWRGATPLDCALNYFHEAVCSSSPDYWEDVDLVRACCQMRRSSCESVQTNVPLDAARMNLSTVATELALLKPYGATLTKEEVKSKSDISAAALQAFGDELWEGWPHAFLSLRQAVDQPFGRTHYDPHFVNARWNLVCGIFRTHYEGCNARVRTAQRPSAAPSFDRSDTASTFDCRSECVAVDAADYFFDDCRGEDWWLSRKYRCDSRRPLRVPWKYAENDWRAPSRCSARVSRSSRLARQMPNGTSNRAKAWSRRQSGNRRKECTQRSFIVAEMFEELSGEAWVDP
jgi:hypothetical protein